MSEEVIVIPAWLGMEWFGRTGDIATFVLRGSIGILGDLCISLLNRIGNLEERIGALEEELQHARNPDGSDEVPDIDNIMI